MTKTTIESGPRAGAQNRATAVLFVCSGNICRSPTAEAALRKMAAARADAPIDLRIDSAGLNHYHIGEPPDARAQKAAGARGYDLSPLRARSVTARDFDDFDMLLAMDAGHESALLRLVDDARGRKVRRFLDFAASASGLGRDVPDPYYGDEADFARMMDCIEAGCRGLLLALTDDARAE